MMFLSLFLVVLLSMRVALVDGVAAPLQPYQDTDPTTGKTVDCDWCPPGTYVSSRCTSTHKSECAPCPAGSFTELWNYIGKCLRCGVCGHNQVVKTECSAESDCQCECKPGYYKKHDMCFRHSACPPGQEALTPGTAEKDTVCHICPNGTYSATFSALQKCMEHKSCDAAAGLELVLKGSTWHDSVCTSCEELTSRDGADYLREILPAFFAHQNMAARRLRRIVHKLLSEGGKKQAGTSGLNLSDLHVRINTWVASATAKEIRQLPGVLAKTGANNASERLQNKLRRIDSHLNELCPLGNEVDAVLMTD